MKHGFIPVGTSSLLTVFAVLCLTVFSLLSLSSAQAENRLVAASAENTAAYYEADSQAEEIFARLRNGEVPPAVKAEGDTYRYSCEISENQLLHVELQYSDGSWSVLRWQVVASPDIPESSIPVWIGGQAQ